MDNQEIINYIKYFNKDDLDKLKTKSILIYLEKNIQKIQLVLKRSEISRFLYYSCHKHNIFTVPRESYHEEDDYIFFERYLTLFKQIEGLHVDNLLSLMIDQQYWILLDKTELGGPIDLDEFRKSLDDIDKLTSRIISIEKIKEFNDKKQKYLNLLKGIEDSSLFTILTCYIPVSLVTQPTQIEAKLKNEYLEIFFEPSFDNNSGGIKTDNNTIIINNANSRWQNSLCKVQITIKGYKDFLVKEDSFYVEFDSTNNFIPKIFRYLFEVIDSISWTLQDEYNLKTNWLVSPNDIENVTYSIKSNNDILEYINYPLKNTIQIKPKINEIQKISLDLNIKPLWHQKCRILAEDYLSLGNTNLALFWLNVGIESFIDYRINQICSSNNLSESLFIVKYWDEAKECIIKQIPTALYEKIKWPQDKERHLSLYKKITILSKEKLLISPKKEILKHYNQISNNRNLLFHGVNNELIKSEIIINAIKSFEWLLFNFK